MPEHHHHAHDTTAMDWAAMGPLLEREAELSLPAYEQAAAWLRTLPGSPGPSGPGPVLDLGSGPGVVSCLLADAFPGATVLAVDGTPELLAQAVERAERRGLADRVHTRTVRFPEGLAALDPVGMIWTSKVVHHLGDQVAALTGLRRLLRPGGLLAVVEGGLTACHLPRDLGFGRPGLEARIDAAAADWFTQMRAELPDSRRVVEHWPGLLAEAGLTAQVSRGFLVDRPAPLPDAAREAVHHKFQRTREALTDRLDDDDLATLDRLLDREDPAGLLNRQDVYVLDAVTVHTGRAPEATADEPTTPSGPDH